MIGSCLVNRVGTLERLFCLVLVSVENDDIAGIEVDLERGGESTPMEGDLVIGSDLESIDILETAEPVCGDC